MNIIKNHLNTKKELEKIQSLSKIVESKLSKLNSKETKFVEKLSVEELEDFNEILKIAYFILTKHEEKKEFYSILRGFVETINKSVNSIEILDDQINELVLSAEGTITKIKDLQKKVSHDYLLKPQTKVGKN